MSGLNAIFSTALSGMNAADAMMNTVAQNVANVETPGYKAGRVRLSADENGGGVRVDGITREPSPGVLDPDGEEGSNVDLATELVTARRAELMYTANAAVVRAGDRMMGTLLDMFDTRRVGRR